MKKRYHKAQYLIPAAGLFIVAVYTFMSIFGFCGGQASPTQSLQPDGYLLFYELCKELEFAIDRWYADTPPQTEGCLIFLDFTPDLQRRIPKLKSWVEKGNTLIMVGIHADADPIFGRKLENKQSVKLALPGKADPLSLHEARHIAAEEKDTIHVQSSAGSLWISLPLGKGSVHLVPDNAPFINAYFSDSGVALLVNNLIHPFKKKKIFVQEKFWSGGPGSSPMAALFKGKLKYVTLHLVLLGILFGIMSAKRFAKPVAADPFKRRTLEAHILGVGNFFRKARALHLADDITRRYFIFRIKKIMGIKGKLPEEDLPGRLRQIAGLPETILQNLDLSRASASSEELFHLRLAMNRIIHYIEQMQKNPIKSRKS